MLYDLSASQPDLKNFLFFTVHSVAGYSDFTLMINEIFNFLKILPL